MIFRIGWATAFLYLGSLIAFLLSVQYDNLFKIFAVLSALCFIAATGTLLVMMRMRMDKQNF